MNWQFLRRDQFFFGLALNFTSLHLTVILPWSGFQVFYLSRNMWNRAIESGYKIHSGGMRNRVEGEFLPVYEEWIVRETLCQRAAGL